MCRHSVNRQELIKQIRDGVLGDLQLIRAYRMEAVGPLAAKPPAEDELLWQFRNFFRFLWVSGGLFAEMDIHQIDEICWLKDCAAGAGTRDWWPHGDERRLQSEPRFVRDRVDVCRRDQGHRCRTVRGRLSQRVRHIRTWNQVCGAVLRQYPRRYGATVSRPADCEGQYRLESARRRTSHRGRRNGPSCSTRFATTARTTRHGELRNRTWST